MRQLTDVELKAIAGGVWPGEDGGGGCTPPSTPPFTLPGGTKQQ